MNGPSIDLYSDDEDVLEVSRNDVRPMFQIPVGPSPTGPSLGTDLLINPRKVSADVMSMSSGSSGGGSQDGSEYDDESYEDDEDGGEDYSFGRGGAPGGGQGMSGGMNSGMGGGPDMMAQRMAAERSRIEAELNEKKEILYQMDRLEAKGFRLPRKFSMQNSVEEMRAEYHRVLREKEVDASVRFQRKMLMAAVTGIEYLNTRFDPFSIRLENWSEQVHENIGDYDDIFEELHEKYKSTGKKMAPELRLFLSLTGSAFMFHLTNSMFKQTPLPGVEEVLRSNPELMRQFQHAAVNAYGNNIMGGGAGPSAPAPAPAPRAGPENALGGGGGGLFSMVGNLFGLSAAQATMPPSRPAAARPGPAQAPRPPQRPAAPVVNDPIESVIQDIHAEITSRPPSNVNRVETMSVSDEEITSIIEDASDMNILGGGSGPKRGARGGKASKRTLQL